VYSGELWAFIVFSFCFFGRVIIILIPMLAAKEPPVRVQSSSSLTGNGKDVHKLSQPSFNVGE
jgi:hypothetical protein